MNVVVIGGGVAGLTVAFDCARAGLSVAVIEARDRPGGLVARTQLAGMALDVGAESFARRGGHVRTLIDDVGLGDRVVSPAADGAFLLLPGRRSPRAVLLPRSTVLGIPARPWAGDVRRVVGWIGSARACLDRLLPRGFGEDGVSVAEVVRARMGRRVLDRLVAPLCLSVHSAPPDQLALDSAAPGLREAWRRQGSLGQGVAAIAPTGRAGSSVEGLVGGMTALVDALVSELRASGQHVITGRRATGLTPTTDGFRITLAGEGGPGAFGASSVVIATPRREAVRLLSQLADSPLEVPPGRDIDIVTVVLDAPELDSRPRGTGAIISPGTAGIAAKALTHASAKWGWLASACGPGRHVLRLSYDPAVLAGRDDREVAALAIDDASQILGVRLDMAARDVARTTWREGVSVTAPDDAANVEAALRAAEAVAGVHVVGAWLAGTGLASVVPQARRVAERVVEEVSLRDPGSPGTMGR